MDFKKLFTLEERKNESTRIKNKYIDRIPIICYKNKNSNVPELDKNKYLVPKDLTIGQFIFIIRTRLKLDKEKGLYFFINDMIPSTNELMSKIYNENQDNDGFLYICYACENTFG
jgi:GABA(A) receptor-associated protein